MSGGLGNQLFSYAAGHALAKRLGGDLRFDLRTFASSDFRRLGVPAFGITLRAWKPTWWKLERLAREATGGRWRPGPERYREQRDLEPWFFDAEPPCFLIGYFQSWRYFAGAEDEIRQAFDTDRLKVPRVAEMERRIRAASCPVMVHVRRGDYRTSPDIFPLLGADHYNRARAVIEASGARPTWFLFSDEIEDAAAMLAHWPDLVPVRGFDTLEDFRLMSLCRHFIIPNSSFAWWAAWLGRAPDKIVAAPSRWFGPGYKAPVDMDARLPPDWVRV